MTGMTITKLEDSENHKNAFEISGIDCKYFYLPLTPGCACFKYQMFCLNRGKDFNCESDQALAQVAWRDLLPWRYSRSVSP